jgi:cbb3-type cytochrome oxidase maturation protein
MESLFLLIPIAIIIAFVIAVLFFWSVKSGQFDDMQGAAHSILMDDDTPSESVSESDDEVSLDQHNEKPTTTAEGANK